MRKKSGISKKKSSKEEARIIRKNLEDMSKKLKKLSLNLGVRFHGRKEESLIKIRKEGLKKNKTREGATVFGDAEIADSRVYSTGKKWSVVHSVPAEEINKKKGKSVLNDYYAGHEEKHVLFDIPSQRIRTYVKNAEKEIYKNDPLLSAIERKMKKEGGSMRVQFEKDPRVLAHKINYYSMLLADEAYLKHRNALQGKVSEKLKRNKPVNFSELRKEATNLGIMPEIQDQVIGMIFLDLNLKKSRKGFTKR